MQKNQHQMCPTTPYGSSSLGQVHHKSSIFGLPRLFLGLNPKCIPDYSDYSVNSPTSPLDAQIFSNAIKSPRSPSQKIWDCEKVGLSLIDSIGDDDLKIHPGKIHELSDVKNIVFGPGIITQKFGNSSQSFVSLNEGGNFSVPRRTFASSNGKNLPAGSKVDAHFRSYEAPRSLPKNFAFPHTQSKSPLRKGSSKVVFEIGDSLGCSKSANKPLNSPLSSPQSPRKCSKLDSFSGTIPSSVSEIELSEDYTCVTVHGPDAQTTHIYADCILSCKSVDSNCGTSTNKRVTSDAVIVNKNPDTSASYPFDEFLSLCGMCKKTLAADKDIYIYRGEKSFCSLECRSRAILIEEGKIGEDSLEPLHGQEFSEADILGTY